MHGSFARRRLLRGAAALGGAALAAPLAGTARAAGTAGERWPARFPLPNGFRPEGIAIGAAPYAYFGSLGTGDVYRASLASGAGRVVVRGLGQDRSAVGLKIDARGRLFIAGGYSKEIRVADVRTGEYVAQYAPAGSAMVNDVVLTPGAAWFTDSFRPQLYRLPLGKDGRPGEPATVPLTGEWEQGPGFTANGIERTPDGRALLVANTVAGGGGLMRVDPRTGEARAVDIGALKLPNADGLLRLGRLLYVVQQVQSAVDVIRLNESGSKGRAVARITDPGRFRIPTTAAAWGDRIYLPNARFDVDPLPDTEYDVVSVRKV